MKLDNIVNWNNVFKNSEAFQNSKPFPFGFIENGLDDDSFVDNTGDRWYTDEYGDMSYMWDYR